MAEQNQDPVDRLAQIASQAIEATNPIPVPPADPAPVKEPAAPESTPATTAEPKRKWFGKYDAEDEAERGYFESVRMGNEAKARADAAEARLAAIDAAARPKPEPEADPFEEIEAYGVPREVIRRGMQRVARETFDEIAKPGMERMVADQKILEQFPDYGERFDSIKSFVDENDLVKGQVVELEQKGNFLAARQIAYLNWKLSDHAKAETELLEAQRTRTDEVVKSRVDAGTGATPKTEGRTPSTNGTERRAQLLERAKVGHHEAYLADVFDPWLPEQFRKELEGTA